MLLPGIRCDHLGGDPTTAVEVTDDGGIARGDGSDNVVQDLVDQVLVEDATLAEALEVILEATELDAPCIWSVSHSNGAKVGLASHRTNACELRCVESDRVVTVRVLILEVVDCTVGCELVRWHLASVGRVG